MIYFKVKDFEDCMSERVYSYTEPLEKESVVVIPNVYGEPTTAVLAEKVEEYIALTSDYDVEPIICIVDMKAYHKRLSAKNKVAVVRKKMKDKINDVKLDDSFKKCAEKDDEMRELYKEYEEAVRALKEESE